VLAHSKVRLAVLALGCILLGWMVTSTLGPSDDDPEYVTVYDAASGGVLGNPSGFGQKEEEAAMVDSLMAEQMGEDGDRKPSVKGALSDLHHAVSDKIQSWNPYASKTEKAGSANGTKGQHDAVNTSVPMPLGEYIADGIPESERLGARTRVGKCTILFNGNSFWERAIRTHEEHDRLHGYRLHVLRQQLLDDVWSKPAYILSLLLRELAKPESERLDWLFWVDADTVILNPHVPIETFLPPPGSEFEDIHLLYSNDWNGLNNGVFPVKVSQWAVKLFTAIVAYRHYKPDTPLVFRDQSAMDNVMKEPQFVNNIVQAPQRWFNAYQGEHNETLAPFQIRRGDLLVHFAGVGNREERMGYWLDRAEQHLDDWEVPVKSTSYPQERKDFWDEMRRARQGKKEQMAEARLKATKALSALDAQLDEYSDRLSVTEKDAIFQQRDQINRMLGDEKYKDDFAKFTEETTKLEEVTRPLNLAVQNSQKVLLKTAHEAIFAGEKDLLDNEYATDPSNFDLLTIDNAIQRLKTLVMAPQSEWQKPTISVATNQLTEARAKLQEKKHSEAAAAASRVAASRKQLAAQGGAAKDEVPLPGAVVVTSIGPATTVMQVQTVVGENVIATVVAEPVIRTVTQDAVAVTLWETVEEDTPEATPPPEPVAAVDETEPVKDTSVDGMQKRV
jgi:hypothetical protein